MSDKELSFIRQVAILTWQAFSPKSKAEWDVKEEEEARRIESFRRELRKLAGSHAEIDVVINGGCLEAVIEDLKFIAYEFRPPHTNVDLTLMTLLGRCPGCGAEVMSEPIHDATTLGQMLETFVPTRNHFCLGRSKDASSETT